MPSDGMRFLFGTGSARKKVAMGVKNAHQTAQSPLTSERGAASSENGTEVLEREAERLQEELVCIIVRNVATVTMSSILLLDSVVHELFHHDYRVRRREQRQWLPTRGHRASMTAPTR